MSEATTTFAGIVSETPEIVFLGKVASALMCVRHEICLFLVAVLAHYFLFHRKVSQDNKFMKQRKAARGKAAEFKYGLCEDSEVYDKPLAGNSVNELSTELKDSFVIKDYQHVLRCWAALKQFDEVATSSLVPIVETMQRIKKDELLVLREVQAFLAKCSTRDALCAANDLLDALGRRCDTPFAEKIIDMFPSLDLQPDARTYETLLAAHFASRNLTEVRALIAKMFEEDMQFTCKSSVIAVKAALREGNLSEALIYFRALKPVLAGTGKTEKASPSAAPHYILLQLTELACKQHRLRELLNEITDLAVGDQAITAMLQECSCRRDLALTQEVEKLARAQSVKIPDAHLSLLVKAYEGEPSRVQDIYNELLGRPEEISPELAMSMLPSCNRDLNGDMAGRLFERTNPRSPTVLSAFIKFYAENDLCELACDVYEKYMKPSNQPSSADALRPLAFDPRAERTLMKAALRCGRTELAQSFLDASPADIAKHITMIRKCASIGNLKGAMDVFDSLQRSGAELKCVVYNTILDACVECRDLQAAKAWMERMKAECNIDVVSYNTLIKAHLQAGSFSEVRLLMEEMSCMGMHPNRVTYNELVNAMIGKQCSREEIWSVIVEMTGSGLRPNQVTCSIILKSLNAHSSDLDVERTMALLDQYQDEPMDEVLVSSVVEACVRIGRPELLTKKLRQIAPSDDGAVNGSHTFGSLIKAYGHAKDMDGAWRCWKEMRARRIRPTSITVGCMVEAIVGNGDTEGAYDLVHLLQEDDMCREALNSVIYCSLLKGFTREKRIQRAWAVYEEMTRKGVEMSTVTYNTIIDASARCGCLHYFPGLLENMRANSIEPNVITYSTMLKGYCQAGDIQQAFALFDQMHNDTDLKADEIMYNSLLDGCAQASLVDEGLRVVKQMEDAGVTPSNFTLSILVKLMSRARRLDRAFAICAEIGQKFNFKLNVHVYTNLIQACISNRCLPRAMSTFEEMLSQGVKPENRTYALLFRCCLQYKEPEQAAGLLRAALGLDGTLQAWKAFGKLTACPKLDDAVVNEVLVGLAQNGHAEDLAVPLLTDIRRYRPRVHIDSAAQCKVMSAGLSQRPDVSARGKASANWKGKGVGKGRRQ